MTRGAAWYNITVRFKYPQSHLVPFAPRWAEDASKNLSVEGEPTILFTKIAPIVPFILGEVGDVSFFTSQSCVRVSTMQLKNILHCEIVDPRTAFNTIVPQYKGAVGLFHILPNRLLYEPNIKLRLVRPRSVLLQDAKSRSNVRKKFGRPVISAQVQSHI